MIDQGRVGLVPDRGDQRNAALRGGTDHGLVVEAPEILEAAAAARHDEHIRPRDAGGRQGVEALMPAATSAGLVSPCTRTGQTNTCSGKRSAMRWMMSRITAPVGEVTTPTTCGMTGSSCLRAGSNRPSAASRLRRSSSWASSAPTPAGSRLSMMSWYLEEPGRSRPCRSRSPPAPPRGGCASGRTHPSR